MKGLTNRYTHQTAKTFVAKGKKTVFDELQAQKSEEQKVLATKLTLNYLKIARWNEGEVDFEEVYQTAWIEKLMFVETAYNVTQTLELAKKIDQNTKQIMADVGLIVSRTGEILKNQEIIIKQNGEILLIVKENLAVSYEILGNVKDIKASIDDMQQNGITVKQNDYKGGGNSSMVKYIIIAAIVFAILIFIKKKYGKKKIK